MQSGQPPATCEDSRQQEGTEEDVEVCAMCCIWCCFHTTAFTQPRCACFGRRHAACHLKPHACPRSSYLVRPPTNAASGTSTANSRIITVPMPAAQAWCWPTQHSSLRSNTLPRLQQHTQAQQRVLRGSRGRSDSEACWTQQWPLGPKQHPEHHMALTCQLSSHPRCCRTPLTTSRGRQPCSTPASPT
jgi:hypothetical protein